MGIAELFPAVIILFSFSSLFVFSNFVGGKMLSGILSFQAPEHLNPQRLPLTLLPSLYRIKLSVPLIDNNFTISGEEWITLNCTKTTQEVVFNMKNIRIDEKSTTLFDHTLNTFVTILEQRYDELRQTYTIVTENPLFHRHKYELYLKFSYELNDHLEGFYKSSYVSQTGEKKWLASTQFSPIFARSAFPCWDEPAFKSRFTISLEHPQKFHSLSNMPLNNSMLIEGREDWILDNYETTLPMSTYLVAFIISDLSPSISTSLDSGLKFTLWSRKDALSQTKYAAEIAPKMLSYLEDYFGIGFPLPKQDVVAVPDFGFTAMENWGLITFRESALLYDPSNSSLKQSQYVAYVLGHELAHQWFGNLVTPAWWNDLWLKEGFADYIGYRALDHVEPKWQVVDQFIFKQMYSAFKLDALNSTHQIEIPVDDPKDIVQIFDAISYQKGASLVRMMSHFLGEKVFRAGLSSYLRKHEYGNACQEELWQSITEEAKSVLPANLTIKDIMDTWTLQAGYPVVTVIRNYKTGYATIKQERFFLLERNYTSLDKWWIPLSYTTKSDKDFENTRPKSWFPPSSKDHLLTDVPISDWLLVNIKYSGYYRVNYDDENWGRLQTAFPGFPAVTKAQLLWDVFSLASAGRTKYSIALDFTLHLSKESLYFPWAMALIEFKALKRLLADTPAYGNFKIYILHLLKGSIKNLTFTPDYLPENYLDVLRQVDLTNTAAIFGHQSLIQEAKQILSDKMQNIDVNIMPDFKQSVYCSAIRHGGNKEWNYVWQKYLETTVASDRMELLFALSCSCNNSTLTRYLNWILDEGSGIRKQDGGNVFQFVAEHNVDLAFDFLKEHWSDIQSYFGMSFRRISIMIETLGTLLKRDSQLSQLKKLHTDHIEDLGSTRLSFEQAIERATFNVQWMKTNYESISVWLQGILLKL